MNVAVRGDADVADPAAAGVSLVSAAAASVDALVVDEDTLRSVAGDTPDVPVLLVGDGRHCIAPSALGDALAALAEDEARIETHPVFRVRRDDDVVARFLREVVLVTAVPASISEYAVTGGGTGGSVRADGLVVATPIGSDGYAAAAGGPALDAGTGVGVVPIAPFSTSAEAAVVGFDVDLGISVERDGDIALFVDGARHGSVGVDTDLRIERADSVGVVSARTENF